MLIGATLHIPDGFLSPIWCIITYIIAFAYLAYCIKKAKVTSEKVTLLTVLAAGIFAAQMLNWPLPGGTSLHFVGGALACILLGPELGVPTMALVLIIQCLVFHDGGITCLGANILNMGIIDGLVGYYLYKLMVSRRPEPKYRFIGGFLGGWIGITLAGIACGLEIGLSPAFPYGVKITVPVMGGWHLLLGIIEGIITGAVVTYLAKTSPELISAEVMKG